MSPLPLGEGQGEGVEAKSADRVQGSGFRIQHSYLAPGEYTGGFVPSKDHVEGVIGFRVRLLETEGRHAQLGLRSFRPIASACKIEPGETSPVNLPIEGDKINIAFSPYQMIDVEAIF
jgi:hypothetical protein